MQKYLMKCFLSEGTEILLSNKRTILELQEDKFMPHTKQKDHQPLGRAKRQYVQNFLGMKTGYAEFKAAGCGHAFLAVPPANQ